MAPLFKNVAQTEVLPRDSVVRVTFAQENSLFARDASFAADFAALYPKLNLNNLALPISKNPAVAGETTAVVDMRLNIHWVAAELVKAIENVTGMFIKVSVIEKLSSSAAQRSTTNAGAVERQQAQQQYAASDSFFDTIARSVGATITAVKWAAVVVVVLLIFLYWGQIKNALPGRK